MPKSEAQIHKQSPCTKIKLQLFPVNENTQQELEKDGYNPFLELTLSARKKISSVIRHLNTKWGSSSVGVGQIMLFPYTVKSDQLSSCRRWTSNDSAITAWDVYLAVKAPSLFRLRYGWCSENHLETCNIPPKSCPPENCIDSAGNDITCSRDLEINHVEKTIDDHETSGNQQEEESMQRSLQSDVKELSALDVPNDHMSTIPWDDNLTNLSIGGLLSEISLMGKISGLHANNEKESTMLPSGQTSNATMAGLLSEPSLQPKISSPDMLSENKSTLQPILLTSSDISIGGLLSEASLLSNKRKLDTQFPSPWDDDSLTTLSIGGLLSEASLQANGGCKLEAKEGKLNLRHSTLLDSFDAFMAAHLNADSQALKPAACHESGSSFLDAEDTCHAFPFQKFQQSNSTNGCSSSSTDLEFFRFPKVAKINSGTGLANDISCQVVKTNPSLLRSLGTTDGDINPALSSITTNKLRHPSGDGGDNISLTEYVR